MKSTTTLFVFLLSLFGIFSHAQPTLPISSTTDVKVVGAMKNVMWKGELTGNIQLDTISNKKSLYGLGPESFLKGELLIVDGVGYRSKVTSDSTMEVEQTLSTSAPFFVYGNVPLWTNIDVPSTVQSIQDLEHFIDYLSSDAKRPFCFKLTGRINHAVIHIQNLPEGSIVTSPKEAHQGQTNYKLNSEEVVIVGFFSTEHKGIFTHHDTNIHMHLITADGKKMGHLDEVTLASMVLYLPIR